MYGSQQTDVDEKCRVPESELESELTRHLSMLSKLFELKLADNVSPTVSLETTNRHNFIVLICPCVENKINCLCDFVHHRGSCVQESLRLRSSIFLLDEQLVCGFDCTSLSVGCPC